MAAPAAKQSPSPSADPRNLLEDLVQRARKAGADAADAVLFDSASLSLSQRLGNPEKLERRREPRSRPPRLRRQAPGHRLHHRHLRHDAERAGDRAVAMARSVPEDPFCGLADPADLVRDYPKTLDICDPVEPSTAVLRERRAVRRGCGARGQGRHQFRRRRCRLGPRRGRAWSPATASPAAMPVTRITGSASRCSPAKAPPWSATTIIVERAVHGADLRGPAPSSASAPASARCAGSIRARRRPRRCRSSTTRASPAAWSAISPAPSTAPPSPAAPASSRTSWASASSRRAVSIIDDPHRPRGLRSKPFDGEGVANQRRALIEDGVLTTWLLDLPLGAAARPDEHRPRRARHLVAALARPPTNLYHGGRAS